MPQSARQTRRTLVSSFFADIVKDALTSALAQVLTAIVVALLLVGIVAFSFDLSFLGALVTLIVLGLGAGVVWLWSYVTDG